MEVDIALPSIEDSFVERRSSDRQSLQASTHPQNWLWLRPRDGYPQLPSQFRLPRRSTINRNVLPTTAQTLTQPRRPTRSRNESNVAFCDVGRHGNEWLFNGFAIRDIISSTAQPPGGSNSSDLDARSAKLASSDSNRPVDRTSCLREGITDGQKLSGFSSSPSSKHSEVISVEDASTCRAFFSTERSPQVYSPETLTNERAVQQTKAEAVQGPQAGSQYTSSIVRKAPAKAEIFSGGQSDRVLWAPLVGSEAVLVPALDPLPDSASSKSLQPSLALKSRPKAHLIPNKPAGYEIYDIEPTTRDAITKLRMNDPKTKHNAVIFGSLNDVMDVGGVDKSENFKHVADNTYSHCAYCLLDYLSFEGQVGDGIKRQENSTLVEFAVQFRLANVPVERPVNTMVLLQVVEIQLAVSWNVLASHPETERTLARIQKTIEASQTWRRYAYQLHGRLVRLGIIESSAPVLSPSICNNSAPCSHDIATNRLRHRPGKHSKLEGVSRVQEGSIRRTKFDEIDPNCSDRQSNCDVCKIHSDAVARKTEIQKPENGGTVSLAGSRPPEVSPHSTDSVELGLSETPKTIKSVHNVPETDLDEQSNQGKLQPVPQKHISTSIPNVSLIKFKNLLHSHRAGNDILPGWHNRFPTVDKNFLQYDPETETIHFFASEDEVFRTKRALEGALDQVDPTVSLSSTITRTPKRRQLYDSAGKPRQSKRPNSIPKLSLDLHGGKRARNDVDHLLFSTRTPEDDNLKTGWETSIIPLLKQHLPRILGEEYAVDLLRKGTSEEFAVPFIRIQSPIAKSQTTKARIERLVKCLKLGGAWADVEIGYVDGRIERVSCWADSDNEDQDQGLELFGENTDCESNNGDSDEYEAESDSTYDSQISESCSPRRRRFFQRPSIGASIGVCNSTKRTATLSCYISLGGRRVVLTVHHLFEGQTHGSELIRKGLKSRESGRRYGITQPSKQDVSAMVEREAWLEGSIACLDEYINFHVEGSRKEMLRSQSQLLKQELAILTKLLDELVDMCIYLGDFVCSSGYRSRSSDEESYEMDWALCEVEADRCGQNTLSHDDDASIGNQSNLVASCRGYGEVQPGALIHAIGRTSGYQVGNICSFKSLVSHAGRQTREWYIMKTGLMSEETWISEGIGQGGDSGALVVRKNDNVACGQVWGRAQNKGTGQTLTYFTPMQVILEDIRECMGVSEVDLLLPRSTDPPILETVRQEGTVNIPEVNMLAADEPCLPSVLAQHLPGADGKNSPDSGYQSLMPSLEVRDSDPPATIKELPSPLELRDLSLPLKSRFEAKESKARREPIRSDSDPTNGESGRILHLSLGRMEARRESPDRSYPEGSMQRVRSRPTSCSPRQNSLGGNLHLGSIAR